MPARYEAIRDRCIKKCRAEGGKDCERRCKEKAAKIYNSTRKRGEPPVGGHHKEGE